VIGKGGGLLQRRAMGMLGGMRGRMSRVERLRRAAVISAAGAAVLGAGPALLLTHGHRGLAFVFISMQVVLVVEALLLLSRLKKVKAEEAKNL